MLVAEDLGDLAFYLRFISSQSYFKDWQDEWMEKAMTSTDSRFTRIVIVGGGVAALETMLALRAIGEDRAIIQMFAPTENFIIRPLAVADAFGEGEILEFDLHEFALRSGATFERRSVELVDTEQRRVLLQGGTEISYDYLVLATGTKSLWVVPGAKTFWGPDGGEVISRVTSMLNSDTPSRVVLTTPDRSSWPIPIYEIALNLAAEMKRHPGSAGQLVLVTPEKKPIEVFGEESTNTVTALLEEAGVELITGTSPIGFQDGQLITTGDPVPADEVITLPRLTGRHVAGIKYDRNGFIPVDGHGRIEDLEREYAAGDVCAYPIKFGGAATQQADVVATAIAADAWGKPAGPPFASEYKGTLLTTNGVVSLGKTDEDDAIEAWDPVHKIKGKYLTPALETERV